MPNLSLLVSERIPSRCVWVGSMPSVSESLRPDPRACGLCAALDRRSRRHQDQFASAAHNLALRIRRCDFPVA